MAVLKLYGAPRTTSTRRVGTVLHAAKVPFEFIEIDIRNGEHKKAAYREKLPFGLTPYIDDDGFLLYETRAICRYIAAKYPACGLLPTDSKQYVLFEQAASVEVTHFDPSASLVGWEIRVKPRQGLKPDQTLIDKEIAAIDKTLDAYEMILGRQKYLAGDVLTLADLFHLPYAPLLATAGSDIMTRKPNVARWYNELTSMPSWLAFEDGVRTTLQY
ncbi:glutathione S-transferase [Mycena metata]|uniref:glutathione transferase n=1 Tax=Mycena metata TaxID=1033252 RepID=A0AAD7H459_9AGAR|nr:glutathione S-transferase [Mycena metata]